MDTSATNTVCSEPVLLDRLKWQVQNYEKRGWGTEGGIDSALNMLNSSGLDDEKQERLDKAFTDWLVETDRVEPYMCPGCGAQNPQGDTVSSPGFAGPIYITTLSCCGHQEVDHDSDNLDAAR